MKRLVHEARLTAVALQFLTRVPLPPRALGHGPYDPAWLNASARHFPLVGALVGGVGALVLLAALQAWPPAIAALLATAATAALTGAFHEDGLADSFDALGGVVSRERALAIMKDSRIGSYGALALGLVTALRVAALAALAGQGAALAAAALLFAHAAGRGAAVALMAALPYAGDAEQAKAKPLATAVTPGTLAVASGWVGLVAAAAAAAGAPPQRLLAAALAAAAVALAMRRWLQRRLGGYTGDTLGATEQLAEAAVLLACCAAA